MSDDRKPDGEVARALMGLSTSVASLSTRVDGYHANMCDRIESLEVEVKGMRAEQGATQVRLAELTTMCAARGKHCSEVHGQIRQRQKHASDEMDSVRLEQQRQAGRIEMTESVLGEVRETSQVTHISELQRAAELAAWRRVGRTIWKHGWKVLVTLAGLTGLGAVLKHLVLN